MFNQSEKTFNSVEEFADASTIMHVWDYVAAPREDHQMNSLVNQLLTGEKEKWVTSVKEGNLLHLGI